MEFETQTHDIDGVSTVVRVIGSGSALLALHGAATLGGQEFARGLADRFRVYLPFHPGFGDSAPSPHICGMQGIVVHTLSPFNAMGLQKPHLMGHSIGGWLAAELAVVAGDTFDRLVLNAPSALNDAACPALDLNAIAPQDLPGYLAHDPTVALAATARHRPPGACSTSNSKASPGPNALSPLMCITTSPDTAGKMST